MGIAVVVGLLVGSSVTTQTVAAVPGPLSEPRADVPHSSLSAGKWSTPKSIASGAFIDAVSCVSSTFCMAVTADGRALRYNGKAWKAKKLGTEEIGDVSCVTKKFCVAVDYVYTDRYSSGVRIYNGSTWSKRKVILDGAVSSVSCTSARFCMAMDANGARAVRYNGTKWIKLRVPVNQFLESVSCTSSKFCMAIDPDTFDTPPVGGATRFNGSKWGARTKVGKAHGLLTAVDCVSSDFCVAVDGNNFDGKNGGHAYVYTGKWGKAKSIDSGRDLTSVSCATTKYCVATDADGRVIVRRGSTWSAPKNVARGRVLTDVSCTAKGFCVAVDEKGFAVTRRP